MECDGHRGSRSASGQGRHCALVIGQGPVALSLKGCLPAEGEFREGTHHGQDGGWAEALTQTVEKGRSQGELSTFSGIEPQPFMLPGQPKQWLASVRKPVADRKNAIRC